MKKILCALMALLLMVSLVACGSSDAPKNDTPAAAYPTEAKSEYAGTTIVVYNWYDYIDPTVIEDFEAETGIKVDYVNFTTVEEMYVKMTAGGGNYDVIVPSDYIIERLIREGLLAELDMSAIPYAGGVTEWLKSAAYDPEGKYSVPFMWGTVGILYNTEFVTGDVTSWRSIFDPAVQRDVYMLDSIRDSLGVTLKMLGYSMNTQEEAHLQEAKQALIQQREDGIVRGYLVDEVKDKMIGGEASYAVMWSGDAMYAIMENESLKYVVPEEGSNVWVDAMCIPAASEHKEAAQVFINYMCRPDIAYRNMQYIYYCTPIEEVKTMMTEEELAYPALNPAPEVLERCEFFMDITDRMDIYEQIWMEIRS